MTSTTNYKYNYQQVMNFYGKVVNAYAERFNEELQKKHLDQILLRSFAITCKGSIADFACGPGQTTGFLSDCGVEEIVGIDITPAMVTNARRLHPGISFEEGNLLSLKYPNDHFDHAICFYGIVHFEFSNLSIAFNEVWRVLKPGGQFLFSFHVGDEVLHFDELLDIKVDIDFLLHPKEKVVALCRAVGFNILDVIERDPYVEVEHSTQRAYVWIRKK